MLSIPKFVALNSHLGPPSKETRPGDTSQEIAFVFHRHLTPLTLCQIFLGSLGRVTEWLFGGLPQSLPFSQLDGWFRISDAASIKPALEIHRFRRFFFHSAC